MILCGMPPTTRSFFTITTAYSYVCKSCWFEVLHHPIFVDTHARYPRVIDSRCRYAPSTIYDSIDHKLVMSHAVILCAKGITSHAVHPALLFTGSCSTAKILPSKCTFKLHPPKINPPKFALYGKHVSDY